MSELSDREMLSAILSGLNQNTAELKKLSSDFYKFASEMHEFRSETRNNFNRVDRKIKFLEVDYEQLNDRIDVLERQAN